MNNFRLVSQAQDYFLLALRSLDRGEREECLRLDRSLLDIQIWVSLQIIELNIYKMVITENPVENIQKASKEVMAGDWSCLPDTEQSRKYLEMIEILKTQQSRYSNTNYLFSQEFADKRRHGLRVTPYHYCKQYLNYLTGLFLHSVGKTNEAIYFYSVSLKITSAHTTSFNTLRMKALEAIELILRERQPQQQIFSSKKSFFDDTF